MAETSKKHLVGCSELPPGMSRGKYFEKLSLLEIAAFYTGTPTRKTVRTWREKSPESARYSVLAPSGLSGPQSFPTGDEGQTLLASFVDSCRILRAEAAVFRTPASFTPSAANRERMREFFETFATQERFGDTVRVWDPDGLWEPESIGEMAGSLDLLVAVDPLAQDPLDEKAAFVSEQMARGRAYLRVSGLGRSQKRFASYELEMLAEMLQELSQSWVLFAHQGKYPDALALARELARFEEPE